MICLLAGGVAARSEEPTVDPFLQAAQWAEEVAADESTEEVDFEGNDELVACGDEVGMAGLIEPDRRQRGRWSVLTELTVLIPSYSTSTLETANEHPILGPRVTLGWENARGFGIRGRGWGFDSAVDVEEPMAQSFYYDRLEITSHQINFRGNRFDLDFYKRIDHSTGHFAFGASITAAELTLRQRYTATETSYYYGYPYQMIYGSDSYGVEVPAEEFGSSVIGSYDYTDIYYFYPTTPPLANVESVSSHYSDGRVITTYQGGATIRNRGGGLGLVAEGSHRFYETPTHVWAVFGQGRVAYLVGQWKSQQNSPLIEGDCNMVVSEAALGLEYRRKFSRADLLVQCAFEVQSWDISSVGRVNFAGVTPGIGLTW